MIYQNVPQELLKDLPQPHTVINRGEGLYDVYTHKHHEAMQPVAMEPENQEHRRNSTRNRE